MMKSHNVNKLRPSMVVNVPANMACRLDRNKEEVVGEEVGEEVMEAKAGMVANSCASKDCKKGKLLEATDIKTMVAW